MMMTLPRRQLSCLVSILLYHHFAFVAITLCDAFCASTISPSTKKQLLQAVTLTKQSAANITVAHLACETWGSLLQQENTITKLNQEIRGMCLVLYGSCLVRTGRDDQAVAEFQKALELTSLLSPEHRQEAVLGRARALQRLLQYEQAKEQFLQLPFVEDAVCGAATCALRIGRVQDSATILRQFVKSQPLSAGTSQARDMLQIINILTTGSDAEQSKNNTIIRKDAETPADPASTSLLYKWVHCIAHKLGYQPQDVDLSAYQGTTVSYLELAQLNTSPFDDHLLVNLDDKVLLHKLLSGHQRHLTRDFWPEGMVDKREVAAANFGDKNNDGDDLWIHKARNGYGSHGNVVLTSRDARKMAQTTINGESLLQKMVQPALLLQGRKFSLRIYVVYFMGGTKVGKASPDLHISSAGLVKMASVQASTSTELNSLDVQVHMTNSGRESEMIQRDLDYLQHIFETNGWSFQALWSKISRAVRSSLDIYQDTVVFQTVLSPEYQRLAQFGIPKIFGFDFVVDEARNPWLIEINRFPGMEARDDSDQPVKHQVLRDTWRLASIRANLSDAETTALFGDMLLVDDHLSSCLEPIPQA
ncbi:polyglutamylase TTLL7 [Seminavis robusta]|uniref:Polyglutamylase TTLL7 n=1 Tax=Seminavis robusta TaxID=568900 RepID=A0A9N8DY10_9STRA|nr:polyglutamylase TTLL7 [Seminavis robusta]|eukprot:Sro331_g119180.1 polyglutamylase TTLL7 (590) ;mRNA; f:47602-49371